MIVAGITTPIVDVFAKVIDFLGPHGAIGLPWPWAIVALTVIVRIVLVPLTVKQIHSMQNLQRHAPEMKEIQRKYKGDRQKMNEELMAFYKENRINPAASCLPILVQIPIFISLFFLLKSFTANVDYCGPPQCVPGDNLEWLGLVNILDPAREGWGVLLVVIYVASQVASTYFMSATMERTQRMIFFALPFVFIPFIINFKAGLVLYWATTNLWTVGQGVVTRRLVPRTKVTPQKKSSRTPPRAELEKAAQAEAVGEARVAPEPATVPQTSAPAQPRRVKRKKKRGGRR